MEACLADQAFRKTFLPQTGALARRLSRDTSFGSVGAQLATRQPPTPARGSAVSSSPWQRPQFGKGCSDGRLQDIAEGPSSHMPKCSSLPSLLSRPAREPGALLGRSASQAGAPPSISTLLARAQHLVPVKELPCIGEAKAGPRGQQEAQSGMRRDQSVGDLLGQQLAGYNGDVFKAGRTKASRIREAKQLLGYSGQETTQASGLLGLGLKQFHSGQDTTQASPPISSPPPPRRPQRLEAKPSSWSTKQESNELAQELKRLGKVQEPMKWANEDIENAWLRREATFEMFKALCSFGGGQDEGKGGPPGSAPGMEGSTRTPTPNDKGSEFEHDALSNLVGKSNMCDDMEWC